MDRALTWCLLGIGLGNAMAMAIAAAWRHKTTRRFHRAFLDTVNALSDGVAVFDRHDCLTVCNEAYRRNFVPFCDRVRPGAKFEDLINSYAMVHGQDGDWIRRKLASLNGAIHGDEEEIASGRWVRVFTFPMMNGGRLRILRDITQRRQVQDSLESTVAWLRGIMDTVADGIVTIDETGTVLSFNRAAEGIFGFSADEVVGHSLTRLIPPPYPHLDHDHLAAFLRATFRHRGGNENELTGMRRDGATFPLEIGITTMNQSGMITYIAVLRDITPRKQVERALIEGETRYRAQAGRLQAIIDNMPQGVAVFGTDRALMALNQAARRLLALPETEVDGGAIDISLFLSLLGTAEAADGGQAIRQIALLAESILACPEVAFEHTSPQGQVMEVHSAPMPDGGLILSFTDITERKRAVQTLREAKEAAERGNRTKNSFLANISHELRTPLNAIIGFSEMMKYQVFGPIEPAGYRHYVDDIHDSGMHLLELINDILDLSKAEAGMTDLVESEVNLRGILRGGVRMLSRRASKAGQTITLDVPEDLPPIIADERRIRQIILNLLSNAIKFTEDGGQVTVTARAHPDSLEMTVTDTGIGMTADELAQVMEPFVQADSRLSRKYEGSGLGLPLAKALVEAHGGTLTLRSEPGLGTVATIVFPVWRIRPRST